MSVPDGPWVVYSERRLERVSEGRRWKTLYGVVRLRLDVRFARGVKVEFVTLTHAKAERLAICLNNERVRS